MSGPGFCDSQLIACGTTVREIQLDLDDDDGFDYFESDINDGYTDTGTDTDNDSHDPFAGKEQARERARQHLCSTSAQDTPPLLPGWEQVTDPASGKPYFWNRATGETSWSKPADTELDYDYEGLPPGWRLANDPASGMPYFFNRHTGATSWMPP